MVTYIRRYVWSGPAAAAPKSADRQSSRRFSFPRYSWRSLLKLLAAIGMFGWAFSMSVLHDFLYFKELLVSGLIVAAALFLKAQVPSGPAKH